MRANNIWNPKLENRIESFILRKDKEFPELHLNEKIYRNIDQENSARSS